MQLVLWDKTIVLVGKYNFYTFLFIFAEKIANMNYILPVVFLLMSVIGFTQTNHQFQVPHSGVVDFKSTNNLWHASVQNLEMPSPEGDSEKAKLLRLKRDMELKYPRKKSSKLAIKTSTPEVFDISGFECNAFNNRVPNDNSMAISVAGILMSCTNNRVVIYDTEADTLMDTGFLQDFVMQFNVTASRYDP